MLQIETWAALYDLRRSTWLAEQEIDDLLGDILVWRHNAK